jgi:large subunit ribosomal protein L25
MAVKLGNVLVEVATEVEVEALPTDLPEKFVVDLAKLETLESVVTVGDLEYDKEKVEIKTDVTQVVVKVEEPKAEEEPVVAEVAPGEVPATEQKVLEEGEPKSEDKKEEKKED